MDNNIICGRAYTFGDNINTDYINPAQYMELPVDQMIQHAMEGADPDFSKNVRPGDIMVAGINFGSGSSRESAPIVIKGSGIDLLIAQSFARIFYRNAINIGMKVLTCPDAKDIRHGDELEVDVLNGRIRNLTSGKEYTCTALPPHILQLINDGGLVNHLEKTLKK